MVNYNRSGWLISVSVHLVLLVILIFIQLPSVVKMEFVEVLFGSSEAEVAQQENVSSPSSEQVRTQSAGYSQQSNTSISLPERKLPDLSDEVFSTVHKEKLNESASAEQPTKTVVNGDGIKKINSSFGEKGSEKLLPGTSGISGGRGTGGASKGVDYALEWVGGGVRQKLSGSLPQYPEGVNVSAQIRLQVVVEPNGNVQSVFPIQKAHPLLEESAIKEVRSWKFEPLGSQFPQLNQTCVITFYFLAR